MGISSLVRTRNDGDQFHYLWAARRCLRLLDPQSGLVAVSIEGPSAEEGAVGGLGEEVIDVGEYYGAQAFAGATAIVYSQLKHSTVQTDSPWTASGLAKTLKGFGVRYAARVTDHGLAMVATKLQHRWVTNRPVSSDVRTAIAELAAGATPTQPSVAQALKTATGLTDDLIQPFFQSLTLADSEAKFHDQGNLLAIEASRFLAGDDLDAALRLRAYVTEKATTKGQDAPQIVADDILTQLHLGRDDLLPAPSRLVRDPQAVPREQEAEIAAAIRAADRPVIIQAAGGVGKSVLATRLPDLMPPGSVTVVFDSYANGEYRQERHYRHTHNKGLVQIANELAFQGLCLPLLPTFRSDTSAYMRSFVDRLAQVSLVVRANAPEALVVLVIDAADNAVMAANESQLSRPFIQGLLRETLPPGVRLVALCRPERRPLLNAPPQVVDLPLNDFSPAESGALLRRHFPAATPAQVDQFHSMSSQNPRVQANALATQPDLAAVLRSLGPNPTTVDDTIAAQLTAAIAEVRDEAVTPGDIDTLCVALAALRPLIPLSVLAAVTGVSAATITSFATDFGKGRWLLLTGGAVQFRDEPVEDWFRKTYVDRPDVLHGFIERLRPLADREPYAAASLPALMLQNRQLDDLVGMALSSERLPADSPLDRREIEVQRLRFALRASLKAHRWLDATKLANKAGEEVAAQARHEAVLEANTDLVSALLDAEAIKEIVARRPFGGGDWHGSRYVFEAALLSVAPTLRGEALSRLSTAQDLLSGWARLSPKARNEAPIDDEVRAGLMWAELNLTGPESAVHELLRWQPPMAWFQTGLVFARQLIDHGRFSDLEAAALAAADRKAGPLMAAFILAFSEVGRFPPKVVVEAALALPKAGLLARPNTTDTYEEDPYLQAAVALVEAAAALGCGTRPNLSRLLTRYLPKAPPYLLGSDFNSNRPALLQAYALRAALQGREVKLDELTPTRLREPQHAAGSTSEREDFRVRVGANLPWWRLRARLILAPGGLDLVKELAKARAETGRVYGYSGSERSVQNEILPCYVDIIARALDPAAHITDLEAWVAAQQRPMYLVTWLPIARLAARTPALQAHAIPWAQRGMESGPAGGEGAQARVDVLVQAARALLALDPAETYQVFNRAVELASRVGDEAFTRWMSLLAIGQHGGDATAPDPKLSYRLARVGEFFSDYVDKGFDSGRLIKALVGLAPAAAIANVSRWRDRGFGWHAKQLVQLWDALSHFELVDARLGPALMGFQYDWSAADILEAAVSTPTAGQPDQRAVMTELVGRSESLTGGDTRTWNRLAAIAAREGVPLVDGPPPSRHGVQKATPAAPFRSANPTAERRVRNEAREWRRRLRQVRAASFVEAAAARDRLRGVGHDGAVFWQHIFAQIPTGVVASFTRDALGEGGLSRWELREFFGAFPPTWRTRLAVQKSLREGLIDYARRNRWELIQPNYWGSVSLEDLARWCGADPVLGLDAALDAISADPDPPSGQDLFNLAGRLSARLTVTDARDALSHALGLVEIDIQPEAADGPWQAVLAPDPDVNAALSGLLWATLGDIRPSVRWQASHVVRRLCRLGFTGLVQQLVTWAEGETAGPFASAQLAFYLFEARLHLMIGLARAALEAPDALVSVTSALEAFGRRSQPHVLIRHYAAAARRALAEAGLAPLTPALAAELCDVDRSLRPIHQSTDWMGRTYDAAATSRGGFAFDYDLSKTFMTSLANAFGLPFSDLEAAATAVIRQEWGLTATGYWADDPRQTQSIMRNQDRRGRDVEHYNAYLTQHACCVVAGRWLETRDATRYRDESIDHYTDWLRDLLLTRADGRWVADRRDVWPELALPDEEEKAWPWSVTKAAFGAVLGLDGPELTIWGARDDAVDRRYQSAEVRSALVSTETARTLLIASQTAPSALDVQPPCAGGQGEIEVAGYTLTGWVDRDSRDLRSDESDPWAAGIRYPPLMPAANIVRQLGLIAEGDDRRWRRPTEAMPLFASRLWAMPQRKHDDNDGGEIRGSRLTIRRRSLARVLRRLRRDLIVVVEISRRIRRTYYDREPEDVIAYPQAYFMTFLFRQDGTLETLF